ncbi:replication protein C [Methanosarcina sp. 2.H.T.1A.6]|uniref:replication factor C large subunit n=1 Tax=unclassified Methanosarcina TaxID=2644672 RepID=UPI00062173EF|nr:replication factor C large subunit [Methanosarcina sp. 2.H.T.1A.3]KKG15700.1 replication protein C [Methanosarcina sp. 2.H.T.1A.3]KKG24607.1 replication protein C [Methanosarcina sp. 2.H.T.1A.6]KKG25795.1 replication protein C [Methanosarcina sp. 2.H.T.1A.8]
MMSAIEWAEKYRPRTLEDVVGNKKAVQDFRAWAEEWQSGTPERRAVILYGPAGIGKTSSAHALARNMDWEVIELNASDQRTAGVIEKVAGSAASMNTFFGGKRLIILDEADNIHGTSDRGGMRAIAGIIKATLQPIVLIANDIYGLTPTIRNLCLEIKFGSVQSRSMVPALKKVCEAEGIYCSQEAVLQIAENAGGDFRSAMNDLQAAASGKEALEVEDIGTAGRDVKENIFKAMQKIFKSTDCKRALESARGLDESPEDLVHWIDENLPIQYARKDGDLEDIRTGFEYISKADLYLGRVKKRQNYRMWRYASMLMVCGAALSKTRPYPGFIKYQQPSLWRRLGQTRSKRDMRDNIASKIGEHSFESMHYSRNNLLGFYSRMLKDEESAVEVTANLELELEELMYLSGSAKASKKLQKIYDDAQKLLDERRNKTGKPEFFKVSAPALDNKQRTLSCPVIIPEEEKEIQKETQKETQKEVPACKSEASDSHPSEDKQKTLIMGFDTQPEIPEKKETSGKILSDWPEPVENNLFSFSAPLPENKSLSESVEKEASSIPSKKKVTTNSDLSKQRISDQRISDEISSSTGTQDNTGEVLKKAEPKTQKTLFDF